MMDGWNIQGGEEGKKEGRKPAAWKIMNPSTPTGIRYLGRRKEGRGT